MNDRGGDGSFNVVKEAAKTVWQPISPELRYEVRNIEEYIAERRFIADYGLLSEAAVGDFIVQTKNEISELESQRYEVDKRIRRAKTPEDKEQLKAQRREISAQIKPLRLKLKEAERIAEHIPKIKDLPPEEQVVARKNLLEYCKLDTYAMVKVWEELVRVAE
mgnify:CR=1 FL=1